MATRLRPQHLACGPSNPMEPIGEPASLMQEKTFAIFARRQRRIRLVLPSNAANYRGSAHMRWQIVVTVGLSAIMLFYAVPAGADNPEAA